MTLPTIEQTASVHPDVVWRELDGEVVLLNVATGLYYGLDETGSDIWRRLSSGPAPLGAIRDGLATEYGADAAEIQRDLLELVRQLVDTQLLVLSV